MKNKNKKTIHVTSWTKEQKKDFIKGLMLLFFVPPVLIFIFVVVVIIYTNAI